MKEQYFFFYNIILNKFVNFFDFIIINSKYVHTKILYNFFLLIQHNNYYNIKY